MFGLLINPDVHAELGSGPPLYSCERTQNELYHILFQNAIAFQKLFYDFIKKAGIFPLF